MMDTGFRKSIFGFNCDDVISYIEKTYAAFSEKQKQFKASLDESNRQNVIISEKLRASDETNAELKAELAKITAEYEKISMLGENIGKLYLVSQNNARSIIENTVASSRAANDEISKNISTIDTAHDALNEIRNQIETTSDRFISEVDELCRSLDTTKQSITRLESDSEDKLGEFNAMFNKINNAE